MKNVENIYSLRGKRVYYGQFMLHERLVKKMKSSTTHNLKLHCFYCYLKINMNITSNYAHWSN